MPNNASINTNYSPRVIRNSMQLTLIAATGWMFLAAATTGSQLTGTLLALKFDEKLIGYIMSIGLICIPFQFIGAILQGKFFNRKKFWAICNAINFAAIAGLIILISMWMKIPTDLGVLLFFIIFAIGQLFLQVQAASGMAWVADLVPPSESTAYWSKRTGFATLAGISAGLVWGKLTDIFGRGDSSTYVLIYGLGLFCGLSLYAQYFAVDPNEKPQKNIILKDVFKEIVKNKNFLFLTTFFGYQSLGAWLSSGFIFFHLQKAMNFSMFSIQILLTISGLVGFISAAFFKIIGKKYGRTPILVICSILKAGEFILWALLIPRNNILDITGGALINKLVTLIGFAPIEFQAGLIGALPVFIVGGFVNLGLATAQTSLLTSICSPKTKGVAIGVFFAITGLFGFITSSQSGVLFEYINTLNYVKAPFTPFNLLAACSAISYLSSVLLLIKFKEDGAAPSVTVVRDLMTSNPFRSIYHAHVLAQPMSEGNRVDTLGKAEGKLVENDILRDLYSPSARVRDSALLNVIKQRDNIADETITEIVKLLYLPELGLQSMAARTLGRLGAKSSVDDLAICFGSEDLSVAQSAIYAAGLIATSDFERELVNLLNNNNKAMLHAGALESLSKLEKINGLKHVRRAYTIYENQTHWVLKRECLISIVRLFSSEKSKIYGIFESELLLTGSQIEKRLKRLVNDVFWEDSHIKLPNVSDLMVELDKNNYEKVSGLIVAALLEVCNVFPERHANIPYEELQSCFVPGNKMRYGLLNSDDSYGVNLYIQLKIWAEFKYNGERAESLLFLAQLLLSERILKML